MVQLLWEQLVRGTFSGLLPHTTAVYSRDTRESGFSPNLIHQIGSQSTPSYRPFESVFVFMKASLRLPIYTTSFAAISGVVQTENGTCAGTKPHPQSPNPSSVQQSEYDNQDAIQFLKCSSFMEPTAKDLRSTFCLTLPTLDITSGFLRILGFQA